MHNCTTCSQNLPDQNETQSWQNFLKPPLISKPKDAKNNDSNCSESSDSPCH